MTAEAIFIAWVVIFLSVFVVSVAVQSDIGWLVPLVNSPRSEPEPLCVDLFNDHRCLLEMGHVGLHEDGRTRWWNFVEFPTPAQLMNEHVQSVRPTRELGPGETGVYSWGGDLVRVLQGTG